LTAPGPGGMIAGPMAVTPTLDDEVTDAFARLGVPCAVVGVVADGRVETRGYGVTSLETGWPIPPGTIFRIASITKPFTATLALAAVEEGLLDLDEPIGERLPELAGDEELRERTTLRHLLTHSTGLDAELERDLDYGRGDDAVFRFAADAGAASRRAAPGELWAYCNVGFRLAGALVARAFGTTYEQGLRERIVEPLGLERTFAFAEDAVPYPLAVGHEPLRPGEPDHDVVRDYTFPRGRVSSGGIVSTVDDLLRFARALMEGGAPVLSAASRDAMWEPQIASANFADAWALGWDVRTVDGTTLLGHGGAYGGFRARLTLVPEHGFALAVLTNSGRGKALYGLIERALVEEALGLQLERPTAPFDPHLAASIRGRWRGQRTELAVEPDEEGLAVELGGLAHTLPSGATPPPLRFEPVAEARFAVRGGEYAGLELAVILRPDGSPRFVQVGGALLERV
jgi:CubicO group peptidase (beta-lactamase class C family)